MGLFKNIAFTKLGITISKLEDDIIKLYPQVVAERQGYGEVTQLTIDKVEQVEEKVMTKVVGIINKYGWPLNTPYRIANGSLGTTTTTIGALVETLRLKVTELHNVTHDPDYLIE
ncbi:MAG: hypothetical protein JXQ90_21670 [Cyclobacteriaceae bacterium]